MTDEFVYNLGMAVLIVVCGLLLATAARAQTLDETFDKLGRDLQHLAEELHDHSKMGATGEFYQRWQQPKPEAPERHRQASCCNRTDCSPVLETQMRGGRMWARFEREPNNWYPVPASVIESNQADPLETPDGRAHGCVIAGQVRCYVEGGGA